MEPAGEHHRGSWGTAAALVAAAVLLSILPWLPLWGAAVAMLLLALAPRRPAGVVAGAAALSLAVLLSGTDFMGWVSLAWALVLSGALAIVTLRRPEWPFLPRALAALAAGVAAMGLLLGVSGAWSGYDGAVRTSLGTLLEGSHAQLAAQLPESAWVRELGALTRLVAEVQWSVFPATVALQSLAVLALAWWAFARTAPADAPRAQLRPLREFRFNDHMVWAVVAGLLLLLLPLGGEAARVGANVLVFMGGLYLLRGLAVLSHVAGPASTLVLVVLGVLAALPVSPFVLALALAVGIGDTWLDVRSRGALAPRT